MTPEKSVALIANGLIEDDAAIYSLLKNYSSIIAVDGGLHYCRRMGITPSLLVGDLDSITQEDLAAYPNLPIRQYPVEKDETDVELALKYLIEEYRVPSVTLFGALGKRMDHTLYNLALLTRYPTQTAIENETELLFAIEGTKTISTHPDQIISLFPVGDKATGILSHGLKWELRNAKFDNQWMSISNIALGSSVTITLEQGVIICCLQK